MHSGIGHQRSYPRRLGALPAASLQILAGPSMRRADPHLRCEIVRDFTRFEALAEHWERLRRTGRRPEIFGSFAFARAHWRAFGHERRLCVAVVFEEYAPVGILPLAAQRRILRFLCAPDADYNDFLAAADAPAEILAMALRTLTAADGWDRCILENVPEDSNLVAAVAALPAELQSRLVPIGRSTCPALVLDGDGAAQLGKTLANSRNRQTLRRLGHKGELRLRHLEDGDEIRRYLPAFFRQHMQRWAMAGFETQFTDPAQRAFFAALIEELGPKRARFAVLELSGRLVACHFGFEADSKYVFYKPTFDVDLWDDSPGTVLLLLLLDDARRRGLREFDFAVGGEWYKSRFANTMRSNQAFALYRSPQRAAIARLVLRVKAQPRLWPALRSAASAARSFRGRLRRAMRRRGAWGVLAVGIRQISRLILAHDEMLVFVRARSNVGSTVVAGPQQTALDIRPGTLSELAACACAYPEELDTAWLQRARERLKQGDRPFLAMVGEQIVHTAWFGVRGEIDGGTELTAACRIRTEGQVGLIYDCWTPPPWRGHGIYPRVLQVLLGLAPPECETIAICSLARNRASRRGIEKAGFELMHRMGRLRLFRHLEWCWVTAADGASIAAAR
jgi:CelD/BcsL family acetyltransferase involved in cellulose biosynthesis/RimJ/RimL family protein N-acetyltransferase